MKKIAILGSGKGTNFEAIANYFSEKDVDITCISNVEDSPILEKAKKRNIKNLYLPFKDNYDYFSLNKFDLIILAGYMKILPKEVLDRMGMVVNIHPSLLPSFKGRDAIKKAFFAGVKVSGVTIHFASAEVDSGKIIAQYPVFITNDMHFDEFEEEIHALEHKLYPLVIEKLLADKVFDFTDLLKGKCGGGCTSCKH